MINNENGNSTLAGVIILLIVFTSALLLINNKLKLIKQTKGISKSFLCTKKYTGIYKRHHQRVQKINHAIFLLNTTKKTSIFIPYIGIVAAKNAQSAEKALILMQNAFHVSYMKNIYSLFRKGCSFTPNIFKTAFVHKGFILERDQFNRAKLRKNKWKVFYISIYQRLKIVHDMERSRVLEFI